MPWNPNLKFSTWWTVCCNVYISHTLIFLSVFRVNASTFDRSPSPLPPPVENSIQCRNANKNLITKCNRMANNNSAVYEMKSEWTKNIRVKIDKTRKSQNRINEWKWRKQHGIFIDATSGLRTRLIYSI